MRSGDAGDFSHRWGWGRHRGPARTGPWMEKTGDRPARKVIRPPPPLQGARQKGCDPATQGIFRIGGVGGVIAGRHGPVPGWKKPATAPHGRSSGPPPPLQGARQKGCDPATQGIFRIGGVGGVIAGRHGPVPGWKKPATAPHGRSSGPPPPLQGARQKGCDPATQGIFRIGGVGGVIAGRHGPVPGWKKPATAPHGRSSGPLHPCKVPGKKDAIRRRRGFFASVGLGASSRAGTDRSLDGKNRRPPRTEGHPAPSTPARCQAKRMRSGDAGDFSHRWGWGRHRGPARTGPWMEKTGDRPARKVIRTPSTPARCQAKRMRSGDAGDFSHRWGWGRHRGPARTGPWMEKTGDRPARKVIRPPPPLQGARQKGCDPATQGIFRIGGVGGVIAGRHGPVPGWKKPATAPHGRSLDPLHPCKVPGKKDAIRRRRGFFASVGLGASSRAGTDRSLDGKNRRPPRTEGHLAPSTPARCQAKRMRSGDAGDFSHRWGWGRHRGPARTGPWMEKTGDRPARKVIRPPPPLQGARQKGCDPATQGIFRSGGVGGVIAGRHGPVPGWKKPATAPHGRSSGPPPPLQGARQKGCDPATQGIFRIGGVGGVIAGRHGPVPGWKKPATAPHGRSLDPLHPCKVPGKKDAIRRRRGFFASVGLGASSRAGTDRSLDGKNRRPPRTEGHWTPSTPARCQAKRMRSGDAGDFSQRWGWGRHRGPARTGPWMEKTGDRPARKVIGPPPALQGARQKGCDPATQGIFRIGGVGGVIAGRHGPVPGWKKPATAPHGRSSGPPPPCKVPGKKDAIRRRRGFFFFFFFFWSDTVTRSESSNVDVTPQRADKRMV